MNNILQYIKHRAGKDPKEKNELKVMHFYTSLTTYQTAINVAKLTSTGGRD